jgi:putative heme-binding domain-containing protein
MNAVRLGGILALCALTSHAAEVIPHRQDKPPNQPYSPEEARQRMTVPSGFSVELVASEPDIVNPVSMTFDDRGRIWITESVEYPRKSAGPGRDRVKILEDTDQDGRADKVSTFADNLNIPSGIALAHGGVWVVNAPDLFFIREKDGKEISREVVVTGFGRADTHELPNSLTWGPDGWLYGLNGVFNPSRIKSNNGREYSFTCAMWRVHPRTREFQVFCEGTSNPWGVAWDFDGGAIVEACHWANDHLFHFVETGYYQRQAGAYPPYTMRLGSITTHGHQKTAYCGIAFFDSEAYPEQYRGRIFVGNIHGGCINTDRLERDGSTYLAQAEPDLLNANDAWFMPVALKVGPDGCLYVLDWYDRYHCYQDANRDPEGIERSKGRLYRLRHQRSSRPPAVDLASETDEQLIERLGHRNIYFREFAQRLLTERPSEKPNARSRSSLQKLVLDTAAPRPARMHALWTLIGSDSLDERFHMSLLRHSDATLRAWAVRAAGNAGSVATPVRNAVAALARDSSPDVQLQVAIAVRKVRGLDALQVLTEVLAHCGEDKMIPSVVWPNLHPLLETNAANFAKLANEAPLTRAPGLAEILLRSVERVLGASAPDAQAIHVILKKLVAEDVRRAREAFAMVARKVAEPEFAQKNALKETLGTRISALASNEKHPLNLEAKLLSAHLGLSEFPAAALHQKFVSLAEPETNRLQALESLVAFKDPDLPTTVANVITSAPVAFVTRAFAVLGRADDPKLADVLVGGYGRLAPELQPLAIELLLQREPWARKLLDAVRSDKLPRSVLNYNHLRKILESNDREAVWAVEKIWGSLRDERNPEREKVVSDTLQWLRDNQGDPVAGESVFRNLCSQCHRIYGEGGDVGPDLTGNGRASFEQLVSNVLDPSLVIGPGYQVVTVVTRDNRNLTGLVVEDNEHRMTIKMPGEGTETVSRGNIKYTRVSKFSMMPENLETLVSKQGLANLFAFLSLDKHPADPEGRPIPGASPARVRANRPSAVTGDQR